MPRLAHYPVTGYQNAERILDALGDLARADSADNDVLQRRVQIYEDWHVRREPAQGVVSTLARATAEAQEARRRQSGHPNPVQFFLQPQRTQRAAGRVRQFVSTFGPLVVDFGAWLAAGERAQVGRGHPAVEPLWGSPLAWLGADALLWPEEWRRWADSIHSRLSPRLDPPVLIPAPLGFYLWAAYMLTALRRHPEWPGCSLFLAARLASMRLLPHRFLLPGRVQSEPDKSPTVRLWGELLDYLALAAAFPQYRDSPLYPQVCTNPDCGESFVTTDRRRRYCAKCSKPRVHAVMASRRYREKKAHPL
jgi:hypothetical protein